MKPKMEARKRPASMAMMAMEVEKTVSAFSSSLLAKRKKVVSIPKVRNTSSRAT